MKMSVVRWWPILLATCLAVPAPAQDELSEDDNMCILCHGNEDIFEDDMAHLLVTPDHLAGDVHWQKGLRCNDCHGGNPESTDLREAHATEDGFRDITSPADVPGFCGHCHSNPEVMHETDPQAPTDLVEQFLGSVHGNRLDVEDPAQAITCLSCHPTHNTHGGMHGSQADAVDAIYRRPPEREGRALVRPGAGPCRSLDAC